MNDTAALPIAMNLRSVDLNLLVAFDALLAERQVTRAANRIGLSQPAMSNALNRLRMLFKDELLVRTAAGMEPTPRALELAGPVQQILKQIERALESDLRFDPKTSERRFTVRMSDLLAFLILPSLISRMGKEAPRASLNVIHLSPQATVGALDADEIDLAISTGLEHSKAIRSRLLFQDRMVCLLRRDHPAARGDLTLDDFLAQQHLKVSMSPMDTRFVDDVLARLERKRIITANIPHWLMVPHVVRKTHLIAVMSEHVACKFNASDIVLRELPFKTKRISWSLYWHRRNEGSAANRWLRDLIRRVCADASGFGF